LLRAVARRFVEILHNSVPDDWLLIGWLTINTLSAHGFSQISKSCLFVSFVSSQGGFRENRDRFIESLTLLTGG
jgi:hypothetical protein